MQEAVCDVMSCCFFPLWVGLCALVQNRHGSLLAVNLHEILNKEILIARVVQKLCNIFQQKLVPNQNLHMGLTRSAVNVIIAVLTSLGLNIGLWTFFRVLRKR